MARHLEETDIPIEYKGMKYNVSPSALRSNNLTVELPEVVVRPTTPQTNDKAYYQRWLIRQASRGGKNMSSSDREAYDRMMQRIANQNEVKNFTGFDSTVYNHGNGALEQVSPEFDILTLGRQFYTDGIFNAVGKNIIKKGKNTIASYDLYNNIKNGKINKINIPSKILYRANVYRGGKIKYPKYSFFTTDEKYASQYGKVNPYIFESKNIAVSKEPLMGYKDPVNSDMMIYSNTKNNPSANAIIGYDKVTGEFPYQSRGAEILNLDPNNIFPIKVNDFKTINFKSIGKGVSKKVSKGTFEHLSPTQWTPEQWTAAQDAAIARGDMAEAQRLRDLHFQVSAPTSYISKGVYLPSGSKPTLSQADYYNGNNDLVTLYHSSVDANNLIKEGFDGVEHGLGRTKGEAKGTIFASSNPDYAADYSNLYIQEGLSTPDKVGLMELKVPRGAGTYEGNEVRLRPEHIKEITKSAYKKTPWLKWLKTGKTNNNLFNIKSANAVTYDDNGVRIPLGLRDNFKLKDLRYGIIPLSIGGKYFYNNLNNK